ncbi:hypothetical protein [Membranihabitans marinus]|uniref:hypothetical protein n=1 Tax=Membranihabitans marinus TaxID=1227546 RepID=UPI001F4074AE|nr:hypothetical protein [Membranihabitans marinus]
MKNSGLMNDVERSSSTQLVNVKPNSKDCTVKRIINFSVIADSVVAKAIIITDASSRRLEIDWGDGNIEVINRRPGFNNVTQPVLGGQPLAPGSYELYHRYEVFYTPGFGDSVIPAPREYLVSVRSDDVNGLVDFSSQRIIITPRYKLVVYPFFFWLESSCDSFTDDFHHFRIIQMIEGRMNHNWDWRPSNSFLGRFEGIRLLGSQHSVEYEVPRLGEFSFLSIRFNITEYDWLFNDHIVFNVNIPLYHNGREEYFSERIESAAVGDGCTVHFNYTTEVKLLIPLPSDNSPVFIEA